MRSILKPEIIYLDWDRTFCSTRGGGSPLNGAHTLDAELLALVHDRLATASIGGASPVHIVTRNSYRDDIVEFLRRHGLGTREVPIHTVKKGQSKADTIYKSAGEFLKGHGMKVLFVDDSIEELVEIQPKSKQVTSLCGGSSERTSIDVYRFLFVRGAL